MNVRNSTYLVIMAGGVGSRLWPMSSSTNPKQTQALFSDTSLLSNTISRALRLLPAEQIFILTGPSMLDAVLQQSSPLSLEQILVEPSGKNTAPAIALSLTTVMKKNATHLIVWPSDHYIHDEEKWISLHKEAIHASEYSDAVLIGITPTYAATGYGYIQHKEGTVLAFHEKPTPTRAEQLRELNSLWNAGVLIGKTNSFRELFLKFLPICISDDVLSRWEEVPSISMDYAILEKASNLLVLPYKEGWSDLGDWDSIAEHLPKQKSHSCHPNANVASVNSSNCAAVVQHKMNVAFVDIDDVIVVCTTDQLLVMKKGAGQKIRTVSDCFEE